MREDSWFQAKWSILWPHSWHSLFKWSHIVHKGASSTGNSYFAVCHGGRQRLERRTAKTFAVSRGRQKAPAKKATVNSCFAVCFLAADGKGSLPSAADGKEGGRQYLRCQSVKWLTADLCRPPQTAKFLWSLPSALWCHLHVTRWQVLCRLPLMAKCRFFAVCHGRQSLCRLPL